MWRPESESGNRRKERVIDMTGNGMSVVYNSDHYYVVEYPGEQGYELVDKHIGRGTYLRGESADSFRDSMQSVIARDPTEESVDEFLSGFDSMLHQSVVYH
jgi:Protein of unknown function (DUF3567)